MVCLVCVLYIHTWRLHLGQNRELATRGLSLMLQMQAKQQSHNGSRGSTVDARLVVWLVDWQVLHPSRPAFIQQQTLPHLLPLDQHSVHVELCLVSVLRAAKLHKADASGLTARWKKGTGW